MSAVQLIRQAERAGVRLSLDRRGGLVATYAGDVDSDLLRQLRHRRRAIAAHLGGRD